MATSITLRRFLPQLYRLRDASLEWKKLVEQVIEPEINLWLGGGRDASGVDRTAISIDAMGLLRDPLRTRADALPYIAQHLGVDLDTSLPEPLQRKILTLAEPLLKERGQKRGIVDAIRLLLGLDVVYCDYYADGWLVGRGELGSDTALGPVTASPGYARATFICPAPADLPDNVYLTCTAWTENLYLRRKTSASVATHAEGWLTAVEPALIDNGLSLTLARSDTGATRTFACKVDADYTPPPGCAVIDLTTATNSLDVAQAVATAIDAERTLGNVTQAVASIPGDRVFLRDDASGVAGNRPITGGAFVVFDGVGMCGGAPAGGGGFGVAPGYRDINLIGAASSDDVARIIAGALAVVGSGSYVLTRTLAKLLVRASTKGALFDAAIDGTAAELFGSPLLTGGASSASRQLLTFSVEFPRALSVSELRAAIGIIETMRQAPSHYRLIQPDGGAPLWRLGAGHVGAMRLGRGVRPLAPAFRGSYSSDPYYASTGRSVEVPLGSSPARSAPLIIGAAYAITTDATCYVRQGSRTVQATDSDAILMAGEVLEPIVVTGTADCYVSALGTIAPWGALRITRLDG